LIAGINTGYLKCWNFENKNPKAIDDYYAGQSIIGSITSVNNESTLLVGRNKSSILSINLENRKCEQTNCKELVSLVFDPKRRRILSGDSRSKKIAIFKY